MRRKYLGVMVQDDRVIATYLIESPYSVEQAAEVLAGEQSTGTFIAVPGETEELKERYRTKVLSIELLEESSMPAFPQPPALTSGHYSRSRVTVSIPFEMVGSDLTTLLASVLGNVYELKEVSALRLIDLELPPAFLERCAMPRFGVEGTRALADVQGRPLIGAVVKPSVGLQPEAFAQRVQVLAEAGADFIKDDELMADAPYCRFEARVQAVMRVVHDVAQCTGRKPMVAFNITGDIDSMMRRHDVVQAAGGNCVQVNLNQAGLVAVSYLRRQGALAIHGHAAGWGLTSRQAWFGLDFKVYALIWRLVGIDQLVTIGLDSKFWPTNDASLGAMRECLTAIRSEADRVMPAVGSKQWGGQAPAMVAAMGSPDVIYLAGAGIFGHPGGPAAGVTAIRQAWEAALAGIPLVSYAAEHRELAQSIAAFGGTAQGDK
ncbi:MAG TPA: RuBisCO large subunit C-terminal-like domain-containing protein [Candidatus Limnocylindrales bacterium]|nr:RuBisCO large subunit C-terminal-like domain-containing protein [Candidatus Limnocylindrales bacterium]